MIAFVFIRKTEENTRERAGRELMSGGSGSVRKTETTENTNVGVVWMAQKQRKIGGDIGIGFGRTDIEKICSGV